MYRPSGPHLLQRVCYLAVRWVGSGWGSSGRLERAVRVLVVEDERTLARRVAEGLGDPPLIETLVGVGYVIR